jgi:hypothetical protein
MATDLPISQKESRVEGFESSNEETTEDYFLQIPHEVLDMIFIRLSFQDLARCMRVCKRFKSMLTKQSFSKNYLKANYSFVPVELDARKLESFKYTNFDQSMNHWFCYWDGTYENPGSNDPSRYVFRPFPQVWDNGIVTPGGFDVFAEGANYNYHSLNKAFHLLLSLRRKCDEFQITSAPYYSTVDSELDVCLFPWQGDKLPTPEEVLKIFYVHEKIIQSQSDSSELVGHADVLTIPPPEQDELEYDENITSLRNTFSSIIADNEEHQDDLFLWLQKFFQPSLMFCSGLDTIYPQLYFHLTLLSPGWVGGVFATIGLI